MFSYVAYGLGIHSELELPELASGSSTADVVVRRDRVTSSIPGPDADGNHIRVTPDEVHFFWPGEGSVLVRGGREIIIDALPGVDERSLRLSVLGPALGTLLHQRGYLTLHASAVNVDRRAIAIIGASGWGKSTLAAGLCALGFPLVADDIVAVQVFPEPALVHPGFPQLRLWPEVVAQLGEDPLALPALEPGAEKRSSLRGSNFARESLDLGAIYVLAPGEDQVIVRLSHQEAFVELVRHTYTIGLLPVTQTESRHFRQCAALSQSTPIFRLCRPHNLSALRDLCSQIAAHAVGEFTTIPANL